MSYVPYAYYHIIYQDILYEVFMPQFSQPIYYTSLNEADKIVTEYNHAKFYGE